MLFRSLRSCTFFVLLSLAARSATAQNPQNASQVIDDLRNHHGLTTYANALEKIANTDAGKGLISQVISGGNYTVFAPTNSAFERRGASGLLSGDTDTLAAVLAYHVAQGSFANHTATNGTDQYLQSATFPSVVVARSLLNGSTPFVNLEAGKGQACVWANDANGTRFFLNQGAPVTVENATSVTSSILLVPISGVLTIPGDLTSVFRDNSDQVNYLSQILSGHGGDHSILSRLESNATRGFTLFAPNDDAVRATSSSLLPLSKNDTAIEIIIGNHYVNGSTFYSPQITNSTSLVSASGQKFSFNTNSTGTYVTSANATAKIVKSDVLVENGVVHFINNVLFNLNEDQSAASSAYQSATSTAAAGVSSTVTGPVTASTSSSGGKKNGANGVVEGGLLASKLAIGLAMMTALLLM